MSSQPLALLCDLQLTKDNLGICRTGLNLTISTFSTNYNVSSTYVVNGVPTHGYFSVDYMQADLLNPNFTTGMSQSPSALSFSCYKWCKADCCFQSKLFQVRKWPICLFKKFCIKRIITRLPLRILQFQDLFEEMFWLKLVRQISWVQI
jgi:hypothetical protein